MESRLQQAFDLFEGGKRWSKGRYARNEHGEATFITSKTAYSFCGMGALCRAWEVEVTSLGADFGNDVKRLAKVAKAKGFNSSSALNDDPATTFEMIIDWFKVSQEEGANG